MSADDDHPVFPRGPIGHTAKSEARAVAQMTRAQQLRMLGWTRALTPNEQAELDAIGAEAEAKLLTLGAVNAAPRGVLDVGAEAEHTAPRDPPAPLRLAYRAPPEDDDDPPKGAA